MNLNQVIHNPLGITVFGSALIRVEPNISSLTFSISSGSQHPKDAFREVRTIAQQVRTYLAQAHVSDVSVSQVSLSRKREYSVHPEEHITKITFNVLLQDLSRVEEVLSGVVDAGINEINFVGFQTTRLKEVRAEARQRAVVAAREKAEIYCAAANVKLGSVLHIEDINPDQMRTYHAHVYYEVTPDDEGPVKAIDPGSITVTAGVMIAFQIAT